MKRIVLFGLTCLIITVCICGCNAGEILDAELRNLSDPSKNINETTNQRGEIVFSRGYESGQTSYYHTGHYYDNSTDADKLKNYSDPGDYYTMNDSGSASGSRGRVCDFESSVFDDKDGYYCLRNYNGQYYRIQKISKADSPEAYGFTFWNESGIEICHYCIYKLYSLKECGIEKGKTTIDDIKPYFPFDDFDFNLEYLEYLTEENEPLLIELQFREGEYQLGFAKKGGNYVLDHIGVPFLTLSVAQSILPKDLALITDN